MPKLPVVAIIGRPNVGKSTLFNRLVGRRQAIVSDIPGTTRDQIMAQVEAADMQYLLIDTGGMGGGSLDKDFEDNVEAQSLLALEHADLILFAVNGREELTGSDFAVVDILRKKRKKHVPVLLVIAKCDDSEKVDEALPRFYELGIADGVFPISAAHNVGIDPLQEEICSRLRKMHFGQGKGVGEGGDRKEESEPPRIAIVGRPNVGKSSLVNALMSDKQRDAAPRLISPIPGTTRDSTDTVIRFQEKEYVFIDTAGLRKQARVEKGLELFAVLRTLQAMSEADVAVLVIDATEEIGKQDKHIAGLAIEEGKGLILLVNKMDLLTADEKKKFPLRIARAFPFCRWAPVLFTSAKTREDLPHLFELIHAVSENRTRRMSTSMVNRLFQDLSEKYQSIGGGKFPFKYVTQVDVSPPTFALFLKDPRRLHTSSLRFIEKKLREVLPFEGTPVRWVKKGASKG
jgi:GTP-binding protein